MADYPRRDFLKMAVNFVLAASGLLGLGGIARYLSFSSETPRKTEFDLGMAEDYPVGSRTLLADVPAILIRHEQGFVALSLVCPHLGCTVEDKQPVMVCPCHGSRFNASGTVQRGPARESLRSLRVEINDENQLRLYLD